MKNEDFSCFNMRGSGKFCKRGSNFDIFFILMRGGSIKKTTISGPSSARQRNAI